MSLNPDKFRYHLAQGILRQLYQPTQELIAVAHDSNDEFLGYFWLGRGLWTTFSDDEIAEYKFIHCDLDLAPRQRYTVIREALEQGILWSRLNSIPVLCSTSIRDDQSAFMRLHQRLGFTVRGSYAWMRVTP
jgi:hypothetical protein